MTEKKNFIGILDSGIGGLSCVKEIIKLMPRVNIIYCADNINCPYAEREKDEIVKFVFNVLKFLEKKGGSIFLLASNTCSAIALDQAKKEFNVPIFGVVDPAIKKISELKNIYKIGLIGTQSLIKFKTYYKKIKDTMPQATIHEICLNGDDIYTIEKNLFDKKQINELVHKILNPLKNKTDAILIGCTHLYFLKQHIINYFNGKIKLIDPSEEVSLNIEQFLNNKNIYFDEKRRPEIKFYVSGEIKYFQKFAEENIADLSMRTISFEIEDFHLKRRAEEAESKK